MYFYQLISIPPIFRLSLDRLRLISLASVLNARHPIFSKLHKNFTQKYTKIFQKYSKNHPKITPIFSKFSPSKITQNSSFTYSHLSYNTYTSLPFLL